MLEVAAEPLNGLWAVERGIDFFVGRFSVLQVESRGALHQADLNWVRSIIEDLHGGGLSWELDEINRRLNPHNVDID